MFNIKGVHGVWFKEPIAEESAFVYDLDDTLLSRVGSKPHLVPLDKHQTEDDDAYILTYRPTEYNERTLSDIEPIKNKLVCLFTREIEEYPFEKSDVDIFKYKISVLSKLCSLYKKVYFFENKHVIVTGAARSNLSGLTCYLVNIKVENGVETVTKTKIVKLLEGE